MRGQALKIGAKKVNHPTLKPPTMMIEKYLTCNSKKNGAIYKQIGEKSKLIDSLLKERHLAC